MCLKSADFPLMFYEGTDEEIVDFLLEGNQWVGKLKDFVKIRGIGFSARILRQAIKKAEKNGFEEKQEVIKALSSQMLSQLKQWLDAFTPEQMGLFVNYTPNLFGILDGQEQETSP
ncbi:MAG: hypothetical protein NT116_05950 [Candidatus Parcubacteria bacterium]|nr:hypothetical protein [Candidatus Parcubacteria bacterium]